MDISTGQKLLQKFYEILFIQLWNFILGWVKHKKVLFARGQTFILPIETVKFTLISQTNDN